MRLKTMYSPHGKVSLWSQDESIQKYVDKFWDAHLKATVFKRIEFAKQNQQFCAGLLEDLKAYVNAQKPRTISTFIHHTLVASKIFPNALNATKNVNRMLQGDKSHQGNKQTSYHKPQEDKKKDKGFYKGSNCLTPVKRWKVIARRTSASNVEKKVTLTVLVQRGRLRRTTSKILWFTPNLCSAMMHHAYAMHGERYMTKIVSSCSTQALLTTSYPRSWPQSWVSMNMRWAMRWMLKVHLWGKKVPITPLIGNLCIHVQGYVDREDFFISPLQHQDVLLGMPWFHRMRAKISVPDRVISFKHDDE